MARMRELIYMRDWLLSTLKRAERMIRRIARHKWRAGGLNSSPPAVKMKLKVRVVIPQSTK